MEGWEMDEETWEDAVAALNTGGVEAGICRRGA